MKEKLQNGIPRNLSKLFFSVFLILLFSSAAYSQNVSGRVSDESGKGLPEVTVTVKGSNGNNYRCIRALYRKAPANAVLVETE